MAILGQEAVLESSMTAFIQSEILAKCGSAPISPNCIDGLSSGISKALIPFLIANIEVVPGQTTAVLPHPPGGAAIGSVTSPGVIT